MSGSAWGCWLLTLGVLVGKPSPVLPPLSVILLGTGNPRPDPDRFGPSSLIEAGDHRVLIDAGRGAAIRLSELGLSTAGIEAVLLTHLHSDHVVGLPDLWLTGWLFGRTTPFALIGPAGSRSMADGFEQAFAFDIHMRRDVDEGLSPEGVRLSVREVDEGEAYRTPDGLVISAFAVDHGRVRPALGYRAEFRGHSVVFSGDTRPSDNLVRHARGVDVLIHEVLSEELERKGTLTPGITPQVVARHTTVEQAAALFAEVRPRLAVYSHIVPSFTSPCDLLPLTRARYSGQVAAGYDLMQILVGDEIRVVDRRPSGRPQLGLSDCPAH